MSDSCIDENISTLTIGEPARRFLGRATSGSVSGETLCMGVRWAIIAPSAARPPLLAHQPSP